MCKSSLQIQHMSSGLCIASEEDYSTKKAKLVLEECRDGEKAHTWFESDQNELVLGKSLCMDIKDGGRGSTLANLMKCHGSRGTQSWVWTIKVRDFYAPNFEKVGSILLSACPCVCVLVCVCIGPSVQKKIQARVLKFRIWIPRQKIAYQYFFSCLNYLPLLRYAPLKGYECNFVSRISQKL